MPPYASNFWKPPPDLCLTSGVFAQRTFQVHITMIGGGYVGLVSGACVAEFGTEVTVVEVDASKLAALRELSITIY
jgi:pyruvate/2-oxoglutarate dehydrogenase complex dihydrolipoamide dehydrogenase (E3) component